MSTGRFFAALSQGAAVLPSEGRILLLGARRESDLSWVDADRVDIVTGFRPDFNAFRDAGYQVKTAIEGPYQGAVIELPKEKALAKSYIADAHAALEAGYVYVDGDKKNGVESMFKACRSRTAVSAAFSKAHGKVFSMEKSNAFAADAPKKRTQIEDGFVTAPGVFSADKIDRGSAALAPFIGELKGYGADLGGGWGYLSRHVLASDIVKGLEIVEANLGALDCAKENIDDPRATFLWADARDYMAKALCDFVVMNPPFHEGRVGDTSLGQDFITAAARNLKPNGQLWVVANRHLPYEATLEAHFRSVVEKGSDKSFKVFKASSPYGKPRDTR